MRRRHQLSRVICVIQSFVCCLRRLGWCFISISFVWYQVLATIYHIFIGCGLAWRQRQKVGSNWGCSVWLITSLHIVVLVGALLNQNWLILQMTTRVVFGGKMFVGKQKVVTIFVCISALISEHIQGQDWIFVKCFLKTGLICRVIIILIIVLIGIGCWATMLQQSLLHIILMVIVVARGSIASSILRSRPALGTVWQIISWSTILVWLIELTPLRRGHDWIVWRSATLLGGQVYKGSWVVIVGGGLTKVVHLLL